MHLTVRMAWHDSGWNGHVCNDPQANTYCSGAHSLLSGRIEKKKDVTLEQANKGKPIAGTFGPASIPPCYWSVNAFGARGFRIEHHHAFTQGDQPIATLEDEVKPYSVLTWPFKLSFVHNADNKKKHGNYPPDLDKRIDNFVNSFTPRQSVVFFYANYDNPVFRGRNEISALGLLCHRGATEARPLLLHQGRASSNGAPVGKA